MLSALIRGISVLKEPGAWGIVLKSALINLLVFAVFVWGTLFIMRQVNVVETGWIDTGIDFGSTLVVFIISWFLYPLLLPLTVAIFAEDIIPLVEKRHYPELHTTGRRVPILQGIMEAAGGQGVFLLLNLVLLPLYLVPLLNVAIYYTLNGYSLGREFFALAGMRHQPRGEIKALRKKLGARIPLTGAGIVLLGTVPVVNFLAPIIGVAAMTHVYARHREEHRETEKLTNL